MKPPHSAPDDVPLLPPASTLRERLARAMREVATLRALVRLAERYHRPAHSPSSLGPHGQRGQVGHG